MLSSIKLVSPGSPSVTDAIANIFILAVPSRGSSNWEELWVIPHSRNLADSELVAVIIPYKVVNISFVT